MLKELLDLLSDNATAIGVSETGQDFSELVYQAAYKHRHTLAPAFIAAGAACVVKTIIDYTAKDDSSADKQNKLGA